MPPKRTPPRRPPAKQPLSSGKQIHYLNQQQAQMSRMLQQQARDRKTYLVRAILAFGFLAVLTVYTYKLYGVVAALAILTGGWMMGWLELVQVAITWIAVGAAQPSYDELLRRADIMSQPVRTKETVSGENDFLSYGCSNMQGWRRTMEDAHTLLLLDRGGFFGVYDGHSGSATSKYCGEYMFQFVHQTTAFMRGEISQALYDGFIAIDKYLHSLASFERGGCAAVVLYVDGDDLYCANAGDSRCVMCRSGNVDALSTDHKPFLPAEQMRIERAGCYVLNRRVNGMLALSRAIGDFMFKNNSQVSWEMQAVTSAPEVRVTHLNRDKDEFAVLACDGIWDMMTSKQVVDFVRPRIQQRLPLGKICEELMDACLSPQPFGLGCDNMSAIIIQFKRGSQAPSSPAASSSSTVGAPTSTTAAGATNASPAAVDEKVDDSSTSMSPLESHSDTAKSEDERVMGEEMPEMDPVFLHPRETLVPLLNPAIKSPMAQPTSPSSNSSDGSRETSNTGKGSAAAAPAMSDKAVFSTGGSGNVSKSSLSSSVTSPSPRLLSPDRLAIANSKKRQGE